MKLNVYKNQTEVAKTFETDAYDLMYGTAEDILNVLDALDGEKGEKEIFAVINKNREKLNDLILDVFPDMTQEDLRGVKVKELIPFFIELFTFVRESFGTSKN